MNSHDDIKELTKKNYSTSSPWPSNDIWHNYTRTLEKRIVDKWLSCVDSEGIKILNAGSGGTVYTTKGELIHLDIIDSYINHFEKYIIGSIENISLPCESVDGIICVGSVLNYSDAQRSISEFSRILKPNGFFIIEFERSNSAEFLCTKNHSKSIFLKEYYYNEQTHLLWLYSEKHIRQILNYYGLKPRKCKRIHVFSTLVNRLGISEDHAAKLSKFDSALALVSYPLAHNVLLFGTKQFSSTQENSNRT